MSWLSKCLDKFLAIDSVNSTVLPVKRYSKVEYVGRGTVEVDSEEIRNALKEHEVVKYAQRQAHLYRD